MTGRELWASLLQEAISGRLVEQRDDEPEVRQILMRPKDVPFDIPEKWQWLKLEKIAQCINGDRGSNYPSKDKLSAKETENPFISAINMHNGTISKSNLLYLSNEQFDKLRTGKIRKGDILLCIRGSLGKYAVVNETGGAIASSLMILRCYKDIMETDFLTIIISSYLFLTAINSNKNGTAQPNLGAKVVSEFLLPVPPLEEQRRIVAKLAALRPLVDEYTQAEERLSALTTALPDRIRASILQEAIQGKLVPQRDDEPAVHPIGMPPEDVPFIIPEKWRWVQLGSFLQYGSSRQVHGSGIHNNSWILDLEDIEKNTGVLLQKKRGINSTSNKSVFKKGDVLYGKLRPYLNKVIIADEDGYCTTEIIPISTSNTLLPIDAKYLKVYLMSPFFVGYASERSYGVKMPRLGTKDAKIAPLPLPPLEEQHRIVAKIEELLPEIDKLAA